MNTLDTMIAFLFFKDGSHIVGDEANGFEVLWAPVMNYTTQYSSFLIQGCSYKRERLRSIRITNYSFRVCHLSHRGDVYTRVVYTH